MKTRIVKKKSSPHFEYLVKKFHWSMAMNKLQRILNKACHQPLKDLQLQCQKSLGSPLKKHVRQLSQGTDTSYGEAKISEKSQILYTPTSSQHRKFKSSDFTSQIVNRRSEFRKTIELQGEKVSSEGIKLFMEEVQQLEKTKPKIESQQVKLENKKMKGDNQIKLYLVPFVFIMVLFLYKLLLI